jgi:hypothetical protein
MLHAEPLSVEHLYSCHIGPWRSPSRSRLGSHLSEQDANVVGTLDQPRYGSILAQHFLKASSR